MADLDRELLAATGRDRPRVAVIALEVLGQAGSTQGEPRDPPQGITAERFHRLGAEVEPVFVEDPRSGRAPTALLDASLQAIGEADIVYLAAGSRRSLSRALVASPIGDAVVVAHRRGAIVVGCGSGAMLLGRSQPEMRRRLVPTPIRWSAALALFPDVVVLPAYDARPEPIMAALALLASRHAVVLGIDCETAAIGRDGAMRVYGRGRVTVWRGRHRDRFRRGETFKV